MVRCAGQNCCTTATKQGSDKRHVTRPFLIITGLTQGSPISTSHITLSKLRALWRLQTDGKPIVEACTESFKVDKCQAVPFNVSARLIPPSHAHYAPTRFAGCAPKGAPQLGWQSTAVYENANKLAFERRVGGMIAETHCLATWARPI